MVNDAMLKKNKEQELQAEFYSIIADIAEHETVLKMKQYRQHYDTSTYEHCMHVAYLNYKIGKKLHLDYKALARAGMLHDLFLYDWRKKQRDVEIDGLHAFVHPKIAFQNASRLFNLNEKEKDIIVKHMWPVTLPLPKYKESFLITFVDKYCALAESFSHYREALMQKDLRHLANTFAIFLSAFLLF